MFTTKQFLILIYHFINAFSLIDLVADVEIHLLRVHQRAHGNVDARWHIFFLSFFLSVTPLFPLYPCPKLTNSFSVGVCSPTPTAVWGGTCCEFAFWKNFHMASGFARDLCAMLFWEEDSGGAGMKKSHPSALALMVGGGPWMRRRRSGVLFNQTLISRIVQQNGTFKIRQKLSTGR